MVEPEKPLKKKDQIALDEELALRLHAEEQAELEKERVAQEEASRASIIKELDSIQAMIEADEQLAVRLQAEEKEQFSIKEKSRMLVEMIAERKKFFAAQRAAEQRSKPPTKTQIKNKMCAYLKNMGGYKHNQLKGTSYEEIHKLFDKAYKQVNSFVPMYSEVVKSSETRTEGSSKRAGDELESGKSKKQKIDEDVEAKKYDDQEEAEMKRHIEIVKFDEVAIDVIPLATKPPMIVEYKIDKDGRDIDREDLETLWKLVKAKHRNTRPEEDYERVLWGDQKVMFEPDIKSEIWRNQQGYKVTIWKLFDTCGLQLLSDYYCWKDYADTEGIKNDWRTRILTKLRPNLVILPSATFVSHCGTDARAAEVMSSVCGGGSTSTSLEALSLRKKAELAIDNSDFTTADILLSQAIDLNPVGGIHYLYKYRSVARLGMNNNVVALEDAIKASTLAPNYSQAYICKGDALMAMEQYDAVGDSYSMALHLSFYPSYKSEHQFSLKQIPKMSSFYAFSLIWKPCQGGSLNLPDHRSRRWRKYLIPAESDSLSHAHARTTNIKT
ncbi:ribonuclease H-like domain, reverse transcriptase, RNA-dependent DNA polymerase [Tanacetum coccineum]